MTEETLVILAVDPTAFSAGRLFGSMMVVTLALLGALKCIQIMSRPTTDKKCGASLLLVMIAWLVSGLAILVIDALGQEWVVLGAIATGLTRLLLLAAFVLGFVGLATYDSKRFTQGRAQAVSAVSLVGLILALAMGGYSVKSALQRGLEDPHGRTAKRIEKPEFNFSLAPTAPWASMKPEVINQAACLAFRRPTPETVCLVIAEHGTSALQVDLLAEICKANLAGSAEVLEQQEERVTAAGYTFTRVTTRARVPSTKPVFAYEHWLLVNLGIAWQLVFWTPDSDRSRLPVNAREVVDTFRVLDPTKATNADAVQDLERPAQGYATKLSGLGWGAWRDLFEQKVLADFGAARPSEALLVVPLRFDCDLPDVEALARGLLAHLDFTYPAGGNYRTQPWRPFDGAEGLEVTTDRNVDGKDYAYVLRVARGNRFAHLVAGWALKPIGDLERVRRSLDAITLHAPEGDAPSPNPKQLAERGRVLNNVALSYFDRKEFDDAARWFRRAFEETMSDPVILGNVGHALEEAGRYEEGRVYLAEHVEKFASDFGVSDRYARLQVKSGKRDDGTATFVALVDRGLKDEDVLLAWLNLLVGMDDHPRAIRAAESWVSKNPTVKARRWLAETMFDGEQRSQAIALLETLAAEKPDDVDVARDLGHFYNRTGEHAKAAAVADKLLAVGKDEPQALMILGWSQMGRRWFREAKATFERAAKRWPDDEDVKSAIREASAELGQGDNTDIKSPIEPVSLPPELARELDGVVLPADFGRGDTSACLVRTTGYRFEKGKPLRRTITRHIRVLTTEGANEWSSIEIPFDPLVERLFPNRVDVKNAEGKVVFRGTIDDAYVRDADDGSATHREVLHLQVPGVQPGHVLEWEVTLEDRAPSDIFEFRRQLFSGPYPVGVETVFVVGDVSAVKSELTHGDVVKRRHSDTFDAWIVPTQPAAPAEPLSVWPEHRCPILWLAGDEGDWPRVASAYLSKIQDRLVVEPEVESLASTLVAGLKTEREKIGALARHVQREIGYKAIEFGVRARRPNSASDTLRLRYGDCKDHALLLHLLLRAAHVESQLSLVNTDWIVLPTLPSLDQFNHMVVSVPSLGDGFLLDPTDKKLDLVGLHADGLWESHALVLDAAKPRLLPPAKVAMDSYRVESRRTVSPVGTDWRVEETLTLQGYCAGWIRGAFAGLDSDERTQRAQQILEDQGAAQVLDFRFEDLEEPSRPARLVLTYLVRNAISSTDGRFAAALPALWERDYLATTFVKDRRTAFLPRYPLRFASEVLLKLPAAAKRIGESSLKKDSKTEFCAWSLTPVAPAGPTADGTTIRFEFNATPGEHPAERYSAFQEAWEAARRAWDQPVSWEETP